MTDNRGLGQPCSLEHAVGALAKRSYRISDPVQQARTDLAELMANGCPSISQAARTLKITQSRCDQHWQAIRRGLDAVSRVPGGGSQTI